MRQLIPFSIFVILIIFFAIGLTKDPRLIPSPLVGEPLPVRQLSELSASGTTLLTSNLGGSNFILNVWASWCVTCRQEHQMMMKIANNKDLQLIGINYKDTRADGEKYLEVMGNPFDVIVFDPSGKIGLNLGVYATPETFLVNQQGVILYKHIGAIDSKIWEEGFIPHIKNKII